MKQFIITALTALTAITAQAQVKETRTATAVTSLDVKNGIEVYYTQANTSGLSVEADSRETLDNVVTEYKSGTLKIYIKDQATISSHAAGIKVFVTQQNVSDFKISNGAVVKSPGMILLTDLDIVLETGATFVGNIKTKGTCHITSKNGSGFRGTVNTDKFKADVTAGSYVKVSGSAATAQFYCSSGSIQAGQFICKTADLFAKQASAISIYTDDAIKINTDTSSSVTYYGEPAKIDLGENAYSIQRATQKLTLN